MIPYCGADFQCELGLAPAAPCAAPCAADLWYNTPLMARGIPDATVEEVKQRIDLAELIASYGVAVRQAGASKKACCPFHHEKTPSFNINEAKGFYHCFGCGVLASHI